MTETKKRPKMEEMTSPKGVAVWPRLSGEPDTKFDEAGTYSTQLAFDPNIKEHAEFLEVLEQRFEAAIEKAKEEYGTSKRDKKTGKIKVPEVLSEPWQDEFDDDGNKTGRVLVRFKMTASGEYKNKDGSVRAWTRKPALADGKGNPITKDLAIGSGSELKVRFAFNPFLNGDKSGLSLKLIGAQVLKLVEYSGARTPEAMGFKAEEGAYEFDAESDGTAAAGADNEDGEADDASAF